MKQTKVRSAEPSSEPGGAAISAGEEGETAKEVELTSERDSAEPRIEIPSILLEGDEPEIPAVQPGKFALGGADQPVMTEAAPADLPESYGTGKMLLAAVDPGRLYAYWDIGKEQQDHYAEQSSDGHLRVRVYRHDREGHLESEILVQPETRHGFIPVGGAAECYAAQVGCLRKDGSWQLIAASDPVAIPGPPTGKEQSIQFGTLRFADQPEIGFENLEPPAAVQAQETASGKLDPALAGRHFPIPPPPQKVWTQPIESVAAGSESIGEESPSTPGAPIRVGGGRPGRDDLLLRVLPAQPEQWTEAQERALAELIGRSLLRREWIGSAEIEQLIRGEFEFSAAGEIASKQAAPGEQPAWSGALGAGMAAEGRGFWLNLNAELVIYGATEPDATLMVGGRPLELRPDGTFSCRFALPDGVYPLTVSATSRGGEWRQAELDFSRQTRYSGPVGIHPQDPALKPPLAPEDI